MTLLGLGTVQIGVPYGNQSHLQIMSMQEAFAILQTALELKIDFWDTAAAYGESEKRIGTFLSSLSLNQKPNIATKIPTVDKNIWNHSARYWDFLAETVRSSLNKLGLSKLEILQFHQCDKDFLTSEAVKKGWENLKKEFGIKHLGVSVYEPEEASLAVESGLISYLQIPINFAETKFFDEGIISKLKMKNVVFIARSVFLQGVLLDEVPLPEVRIKNTLAEFREQIKIIVSKHGFLSLKQAALSYIFEFLKDQMDIAVLGVQSAMELRQNALDLKNLKSVSPEFLKDIQDVVRRMNNPNLLSPRFWNMS